MRRRAALFVAFGLALLLGPAAAWGDVPIPPAPTRWVTDPGGFLSPPALAALDARLEAVQTRTGHQVLIWIGQSLGGAPLDDWSARTFAAWKVGRKGFDDGLVMFVFAADRTVDIEVGYGLEGQVTDILAKQVISDVMAPRLRAGDHDGALTAGADALLRAIGAGDVEGAVTAPAPAAGHLSLPQLILYGLLAIAFLILCVTHPRLAMLFMWSVFSGGRGGGGGFGGGGGGGGGFSGGGGRSGGGGARGSW